MENYLPAFFLSGVNFITTIVIFISPLIMVKIVFPGLRFLPKENTMASKR